MKTLTELIQNYQNGIPDSDSEILKRMEPHISTLPLRTVSREKYCPCTFIRIKAMPRLPGN